MRAFVTSLFILLLACLCQGCILVPVPASGKKATCGTRISKEETSFIKAGQTTRAEVIARFGQPFVVCERHAGIAYNWAVITWYWYAMAGTGPPGLYFDNGTMSERNEVLMFQFDRENRVQRFKFKHLSDDQWAKDVLCQWAETKTY